MMAWAPTHHSSDKRIGNTKTARLETHQEEVEHEEEVDRRRENHVDGQQRVCLVSFGQDFKEHVELGIHRGVQVLELRAVVEAPR
eukprot:654742-Rhodomonas_salina.4